jgi:ribosomal-protein-alanine N-acetyltransferase
MTIRYASPNDFDRIYEIEKRVFSNPWSKESIKKELDNYSKSLNLISEIDGQLMGYFFSHMISNEVHILNIAIDVPFQHRGNGKAFFNQIFKKYLEYANVFLEVKRTNLPAINLYNKFGFEEIDIRKMYYSDGQDAVVMSRKVD